MSEALMLPTTYEALMAFILALAMAAAAAVGQYWISIGPHGPHVKPVKPVDPGDAPDYDELCEKPKCNAAKIRLTNARNELVVACTRYTAQERVKNNVFTAWVALGAAMLAAWGLFAAAGFFSKIPTLIAALVATAAFGVASIVLAAAKKKLNDRQDEYDACVTEFRAAVAEAYKHCNSYCWQTMNLDLPQCL